MSCIYLLADEVDYGIDIKQIGLGNDENGYFHPTKQLALTCQHNAIHFDLTTNSGKSLFTLLTAAKMAGKKLTNH